MSVKSSGFLIFSKVEKLCTLKPKTSRLSSYLIDWSISVASVGVSLIWYGVENRKTHRFLDMRWKDIFLQRAWQHSIDGICQEISHWKKVQEYMEILWWTPPEQLKGAICNLAKKKGIRTQEILQFFMFERIIDRLSISPYKDRFILKADCWFPPSSA